MTFRIARIDQSRQGGINEICPDFLGLREKQILEFSAPDLENP